MLEKFNKHFSIIVLIFGIILPLIAVWHWFSGDSILYFWDSYVPFDLKISFNQLFYFWQDRLFPGYQTPGVSWLLYWGIFFLPSLLGLSLSNGQFFVYFLLLFLSIVNFYFLLRHILEGMLKNSPLLVKSTSLIFALLYTFNVYTFFNFYFMFNPGTFILAFFPLNLLALLKLYPLTREQGSRKNIWLSIFYLSLIGMSSGFTVYVFFLQYLIWIIFYILIFWFVNKYKLISWKTLELLLFYSSVFVVNLWWFFPAFLNLQNAYSSQSSFGTYIWFLEGFKQTQLLNSFRLLGSGLMSNNRFGWSQIYENNFLFTLPLFILPGLFLASLVFLKQKINYFLIFLLCMFVVSLFIVKFSNPPFAWILGFAFNHVPFFGGFRDSFQKAGVFFLPSYLVFTSIGFIFVYKYLLDRNSKIRLLIFSITLVLAAIVLSGPFFLFSKDNIIGNSFEVNDKKYTLNAKTKIPPEYYSFKSFVEPICEGEVIAEIPRSGFVSDAVWEKYKTSYAGQSILPSIVSCRFLTTAMFDGGSESAIQAPYLFMQRKDMEGFKNYLTQNGINLVLIRRDFVPINLVKWVHVEPKEADRFLSSDADFKKIYSNDFLILYEKKNYDKGLYGFNLTNNVVYLGSNQNSGLDFLSISKTIGPIRQPVFLTTTEDRKEYRDKSMLFTTTGNCMGCVKIDIKARSSKDKGLIENLKRRIKPLVKKEDNISSDVRISLDIIAAHSVFGEIIAITDGNTEKSASEKIGEYKRTWNDISEMIVEYDADKFTKINKYTEARNFLASEYDNLSSIFSYQLLKEEKYLNVLKNRKDFISLLSFQNDLIRKFSKEIKEADFNKNIYTLRLDVPTSREYKCKLDVVKNNADIASLKLDGKNLSINQINGYMPIFLKEGSYLIEISYLNKDILEFTKIDGVFNPVDINLGNLGSGTYRIKFSFSPESSGKMLIALAKGSVSAEELERIGSSDRPGEKFIFADLINKEHGREYIFSKNFGIDDVLSEGQRLYIYNLDSPASSTLISNFSLSTFLDKQDLQFSCSSQVRAWQESPEIEVSKISPTRYELLIPMNYVGFISFNHAFNPDWIAYMERDKKELPHLKSSYSNAWYIEKPIDGKIIVEFKKQKQTEEVAKISIGVFIVILIIYKILLWKK